MTRILSDEQKKKAVERARRWALANPDKVRAAYLKHLAKKRKGRRPASTERAESAVCSKCGEKKPASRFGTAPFHLKRNGLRSWCSDCELEKCREWRTNHKRRWLDGVAATRKKFRDRNKERERTAYRLNSEAKKAQTKKWRECNPEKAKAHAIAGAAISSGRLKKPVSCPKCGATERLQKHHPDYKKPLEVLWLCQPCHKKLHRELKGERSCQSQGK